MCTRSVDRKYGVLLAAALAVLAAPHLARAQGYPSNFDFGAAASVEDIGQNCRAWPDCRICRPVRYYG
jgi:hypothetical protein